jgi:Ca-activated chloride channel family protein
VSFVHPESLWLLLLLIPVAVWAIFDRRRRRRDWQRLAQRGRPRSIGSVRVLITLGLIVVALSQPRWGGLRGVAASPGHDVVLIVDVSRSMAATDAVPDRLAVAIDSATSLVEALASDPANRAAVVAFAGRGVLRCPLTENSGAVLDALRRLSPNAVMPGGTDLGAALDAAMDALDAPEEPHGRAFVIFSDGEDLADTWSLRLEKLGPREIVVHAVTIGDAAEGHSIPMGKGDPTPLKYHGQPVLSRRSDAALAALTSGTGGLLVPLGLTSTDLGSLYRTRIEPAARRQRTGPRLSERAEAFPLALAAGLFCLVSTCWPRPRAWGSSFRRWPRKARNRAVAALAIAFAALVAGAGGDRAPGSSAETAAEAVARGRAAFAAKRFDDALAAFNLAIDRSPRAAVPRYNAAATLYERERYQEARDRYREARELAGPVLRAKIDYALGNAALMLGDLAGAVAAYDDCLASTATGKELDSVKRDARANRQFALEQPRPPTLGQAEDPGDRPNANRPDRSRPEEPPDAGPDGQAAENQGGGQNSSERGDERTKRTRRRSGGAGGTRPSTGESPGDSPNDRLDAALEHIRAAQSRRLPEDAPTASSNEDRKDW